MFSLPSKPPIAGLRLPIEFRRRRRTDRALRRLRGFTAATFRRLRLRLRLRGFTAANAVFRRRDRRRVALRLRLFATLTLLVLYLIFVITLVRFLRLRRGAARVFLRRRELLRLRLGLALATFISWPLAFLRRPFSVLRRRLRAFAIVVLLFRFGLLPIKARCGFRRFRFTVFFLFVFVNAPRTFLDTFEAMSPARRSVRALLRRALRRRPGARRFAVFLRFLRMLLPMELLDRESDSTSLLLQDACFPPERCPALLAGTMSFQNRPAEVLRAFRYGLAILMVSQGIKSEEPNKKASSAVHGYWPFVLRLVILTGR